MGQGKGLRLGEGTQTSSGLGPWGFLVQPVSWLHSQLLPVSTDLLLFARPPPFSKSGEGWPLLYSLSPPLPTLVGAGAGTSRATLGSWVKAHVGRRPQRRLPSPRAPQQACTLHFQVSQVPSFSCLLPHLPGFHLPVSLPGLLAVRGCAWWAPGDAQCSGSPGPGP